MAKRPDDGWWTGELPAADTTTDDGVRWHSSVVDVLDSSMHCVEAGAGEPIVFLHGNPTSSYLWRDVIGEVARAGWNCLAIDLIGMGRSGKPDLDYRLADHISYVEAFLQVRSPGRVTLVGHDWGAVIALDYARRFPQQVAGVVLLEGHIHPIDQWQDLDEGGRELFQRLRTPGLGEQLIIAENFFVEVVLPSGMLRQLAPQEFDVYRHPFQEPGARLPLWRWPQEIPIAGAPADVAAVVTANQTVLTDPEMPKLLLYGEPGAVIGAAEITWCREHGQAMSIVKVGAGTHFLPEDRPSEIAGAVVGWLDSQRQRS